MNFQRQMEVNRKIGTFYAEMRKKLALRILLVTKIFLCYT